MNQFERILMGLMKPINPYATLLLGMLTFAWGFWVANPFWTVFSSAPVYSKASDFAPEWAWGTWSLICGSIIIFAVFKGMYKTLARALGFVIWHWFTIAGMFWWGDWHNTAGVMYTFVAVFSLYCYLNIKMNNPKDSSF